MLLNGSGGGPGLPPTPSWLHLLSCGPGGVAHVAGGSLEPTEGCWQQQGRVGDQGPVLIFSSQGGENLQLKGCAVRVADFRQWAQSHLRCAGFETAVFLCRGCCLSRTPEAGQSGQDCIGRSLPHPGGHQHRAQGTLCNSSQAFPAHCFFPSCAGVQPPLPSCLLACLAGTLLAKLSGKAWPG